MGFRFGFEAFEVLLHFGFGLWDPVPVPAREDRGEVIDAEVSDDLAHLAERCFVRSRHSPCLVLFMAPHPHLMPRYVHLSYLFASRLPLLPEDRHHRAFFFGEVLPAQFFELAFDLVFEVAHGFIIPSRWYLC